MTKRIVSAERASKHRNTNEKSSLKGEDLCSGNKTARFIQFEGNQIFIDPEIFQDLESQLISLTETKSLEDAIKKVQTTSRAMCRVGCDARKDVFSVNKCFIGRWAKSINLYRLPGLCSNHDIAKGSYEGGFKVWECTNDLVKFIAKDPLIDTILRETKTRKFNSLELGAGAALPSLALLDVILSGDYKQKHRIHLQDFNWEVLASLTFINLLFNFPLNVVENLFTINAIRLYHGDWKNCTFKHKYHLIMMSEVVYEASNFETLHLILERSIKRRGYVIMAAKDNYFGLSGGQTPWMDFIMEKNQFEILRKIEVTESSIPRSIVIMRPK